MGFGRSSTLKSMIVWPTVNVYGTSKVANGKCFMASNERVASLWEPQGSFVVLGDFFTNFCYGLSIVNCIMFVLCKPQVMFPQCYVIVIFDGIVQPPLMTFLVNPMLLELQASVHTGDSSIVSWRRSKASTIKIRHGQNVFGKPRKDFGGLTVGQVWPKSFLFPEVSFVTFLHLTRWYRWEKYDKFSLASQLLCHAPVGIDQWFRWNTPKQRVWGANWVEQPPKCNVQSIVCKYPSRRYT